MYSIISRFIQRRGRPNHLIIDEDKRNTTISIDIYVGDGPPRVFGTSNEPKFAFAVTWKKACQAKTISNILHRRLLTLTSPSDSPVQRNTPAFKVKRDMAAWILKNRDFEKSTLMKVTLASSLELWMRQLVHFLQGTVLRSCTRFWTMNVMLSLAEVVGGSLLPQQHATQVATMMLSWGNNTTQSSPSRQWHNQNQIGIEVVEYTLLAKSTSEFNVHT